MRSGIVWLAVVLIFHVNQAYAQHPAEKYAAGITAEELREHLTIIAADEFEGRETGKPGQLKAAEFLLEYYRTLGIPGGNQGSYLQEFPLKQERIIESFLDLEGAQYKFIDDFYFFTGNKESDLLLNDVVFVGYGIDDNKYSDYSSKMSVQGKVVICLSGEPRSKDGTFLLSGDKESGEWSNDPGMKIDAAEARGARALIIVQQDYDRFIPRVRFWLESPRLSLDYPEGMEEVNENALPFFFVSPRVGDAIVQKLFKKNLSVLAEKWNKNGKAAVKAGTLSGKVAVRISADRMVSHNVIALIEGTDEQLRDEVVVISAHYDHVGVINGEIHNGADDDGSGTVTAMELAEALLDAKQAGVGPRRSVMILHVSGEEKGLLGSEWYTEFPTHPLEGTVCNLNIDMIGRVDEEHADNENYVYLIGSDKLSTQLHRISEESNATHTQLELDYTFNDPNDPNRFYYRSDHYNFARRNIPVIFYFSGVHEDYHRPGDDAEKIRYEKMARIGRLIFHTAWEVANRDERIPVDVTTPED
jgi:hypothetical protein